MSLDANIADSIIDTLGRWQAVGQVGLVVAGDTDPALSATSAALLGDVATLSAQFEGPTETGGFLTALKASISGVGPRVSAVAKAVTKRITPTNILAVGVAASILPVVQSIYGDADAQTFALAESRERAILGVLERVPPDQIASALGAIDRVYGTVGTVQSWTRYLPLIIGGLGALVLWRMTK